MNALTKLTAAALAACSIAGGVAVAQQNTGTEATMNPDTANYGTPAGAPLKRDGSISASGVATGTVDNGAASTTTTTTQSTTTDVAPAAAPAPVDTTTTDNASTSAAPAMEPKADRN